MRISDMRLFQIMKHLQSFPSPQSKITNKEKIESWTPPTTIQETLATIDTLTEEKETETKPNEVIQIQANFELSKVRINKNNSIVYRLFRLIFFLKKKKMLKNIHFFVYHSYQYVYKH